jgi:hypothetical protein
VLCQAGHYLLAVLMGVGAIALLGVGKWSIFLRRLRNQVITHGLERKLLKENHGAVTALEETPSELSMSCCIKPRKKWYTYPTVFDKLS